MIENSKFPETYNFTYILVGIKNKLVRYEEAIQFQTSPKVWEEAILFLNLEVWSRLHLDINSCTL